MNENSSATTLLAELHEELQRERRKTATRAKSWIAVRAGVVLLVAAYMTWLGGALGRISAEELTRFAATSLESKLPELRADLRDYAISVAPEVTDRARDFLLEVPGRLRTVVERELWAQTDRLIARLEVDMDLAIATVIDEQLELVRAQDPNVSPEAQLDTIVLGVSDAFREALIDGIDELYEHSTREVQSLNAYLEHLLKNPDLTQSEQIDRQLLQVWMVLVHKQGITEPDEAVIERVAANF